MPAALRLVFASNLVRFGARSWQPSLSLPLLPSVPSEPPFTRTSAVLPPHLDSRVARLLLPWMPSVLQWPSMPLISACSVSVHCLCARDLLHLYSSVADVVPCARTSALSPALHLRSVAVAALVPCARIPAPPPAHAPRSQTQWRQPAGTVLRSVARLLRCPARWDQRCW